MILDQVVRSERRSIEQIIRALTNNLTARDNLAPDGSVGQVLMSNGPGRVPSFQDLPAAPDPSEDTGEIEASRIVGTLADARLQGSYRGITSVDETAVTEHEAALSIGWTQITGTPTTIAGYGITDAYTKTEVDALLDALSFADIDGSIADAQVPESAVTQHEAALSIGWSQLTSVPTTLAGYGITDAYTKSATDTLLAAKADSATTLAGYGITDAYTKSAVDALLAALTTGDLTDWPADAAGVLTNDGAGTLTWEAAGGGGAVSSVFTRTGAVVAASGDYDISQIDAGTFQVDDFTLPDGAQIIGTASTTNWHPFSLVGDAVGDGWVGAIPFFDSALTRYGYVGKDNSANANVTLMAQQGSLHLYAGFDAGDSIIYGHADYIYKDAIGGVGHALSALAAEEFHFLGHQTSDNVEGLSWAWGSVPASAQAKVIVQMSGSYGSKMYFMTTNSFATGAQTAMLIDHLGVISINRTTGKLIPATDGVQALGDSSHLWDAVYSEKYFGKNNIVCGSGTISSATATLTVNCTAVTANSCIFLQITDLTTSPTTVLKVTAKIPGTSFTVWRDLSVSTNSVSFRWFLIDTV